MIDLSENKQNITASFKQHHSDQKAFPDAIFMWDVWRCLVCGAETALQAMECSLICDASLPQESWSGNRELWFFTCNAECDNLVLSFISVVKYAEIFLEAYMRCSELCHHKAYQI